MAELGQHRVAKTVDRCARSRVANVAQGAPSGSLDLLTGFFDQCFAAAGGDDIGARGSQSGGQLPAKA